MSWSLRTCGSARSLQLSRKRRTAVLEVCKRRWLLRAARHHLCSNFWLGAPQKLLDHDSGYQVRDVQKHSLQCRAECCQLQLGSLGAKPNCERSVCRSGARHGPARPARLGAIHYPSHSEVYITAVLRATDMATTAGTLRMRVSSANAAAGLQ